MLFSRRPSGMSRPSNLSLTGLFAALCLAGCLERDNPFDPLNRISPIIPEIRAEEKPVVDSLERAGRGESGEADAFLNAFRRDSLANDSIAKGNEQRQGRNTARQSANAAQETANRNATHPDSLRPLAGYDPLDELNTLGPYAALNAAQGRVDEAIARIEGLMAATNRREYPLEIYSQAYVDSVLGPLRLKSADFAALSGRIGAANLAIGAANAGIREYNQSVAAWNKQVKDYNDLLDFRRESLKHGVITRADSLSKALDSAKPGDTILVGEGEFAGDLRFVSGTQAARIVIRGYPGLKTIIRPRGDTSVLNQAGIISKNSHIRFEDLVFRGGKISGIKLEDDSRDITFKRCLFDSSGIWGIDASSSDLELIDCEIRDNGGGIRVEMTGASNYTLRLENVLVARNRGRGIEAISPAGSISNATLSDNAGDGLHIAAHQRSLTVTNSILSFNTRFGIYRDATPYNADGLTVRQTVLWENGLKGTGGNWSLVNLDSAMVVALKRENWEEHDPGFVDHAAGDYTLHPDSWVLERESLPLIIGYRRKF